MPKQTELEGIERPKIKAIEDAADAYVAVRDKRMALTDKEVAAKANLIAVLIKHEKELTKNEKGEALYRYDEELVILEPGKVGVKVKGVKAGDEDEPED